MFAKLFKKNAKRNVKPVSRRARPQVEALETREVLTTLYGLTTDNFILTFDSATPNSVDNAVALSGMQPGENIIGIDSRPATGQLYAVGDTSRLYTVDPNSGVLTQVGSGPFGVSLTGKAVGFDFNPDVDLIRVVTDAEDNFALSPVTGAVAAVQTNLSQPGVTPANLSVVAVGYNNINPGGPATQFYGIDSLANTLVRVPPPVAGGVVQTVGSLGVNPINTASLDIAADGTAYAALTAPGATTSQLYTIDLTTGAATLVDDIGDPVALTGLTAAQPPRPAVLTTVYGLTTDNFLINFEATAPQFVDSVQLTGMQPGENIIGIDFRPATGDLYALGSTSRLYTVNTSNGVLTQVGSGPFSPALNGTAFGFDFNPVVDLIRLVGDNEQNLAVEPNLGVVAAVQGNLNPGDPNIVAVGYTNNVNGATSTTFYGIDSIANTLVTVPNPAVGTITTVGSLGVNPNNQASLDIAPSGTAYAVLTAPGATTSQFYTISLTTGQATYVGDIGAPSTLRGVAVAVADPGDATVQLGAATFTAAENSGTAAVTLTRTGNLGVRAVVTLTASAGTATAGTDFTAGAQTVSFAPGVASVTVNIPLVNDFIADGSETVNLALSNPRLGAVLGTQTSAVLTIQDPAGTPNQNFVDGLFRQLLNRPADAGALTYFAGLLDGGLATRAGVVGAIQNSTEARSVLVQRLYQSILRRTADPAGLAGGVQFLAFGTVDQFRSLLFGSAEYFQNQGGGTVNGFLNALFQDALGRAADAGALSYFGGLLAGGVGRNTVALIVLRSTEADRLTVQSTFQQALGRTVDPSGQAFFTQTLQAGLRDETLLAILVASDEFFAKAQV